MIRIKTRKQGKLLTAVYTDEGAGDAVNAARLLGRFRDLDGFEPKFAALRDLDRSADEDNHSRQIRVDASVEEILNALAVRPCGKVYLAGSYRGIRTGVGVNFKEGEVLITLPAEHIDLADEMVWKL